MIVKPRDLLPGTHLKANGYFPGLTWDDYGSTYDAWKNNPSITNTNVPIYDTWKQMCMSRFGKIPTGAETTDERMFTWNAWESGLRRTFMTLANNPYDESRTTQGEEIRIAIESDGTMPVMQGNKRISMLHWHNDLDRELDAIVGYVDPGWTELVNTLANIYGKEGVLYHPSNHPWFRDWPVAQPCTERFAMMKAFLPNPPESMLDIGSHTGWFCRQYIKEWGTQCTGIELQQPLIDMAIVEDTFRREEKQQPTYVCKEFDGMNNDVDVVNLLSVIMHMFCRMGNERTWEAVDSISKHCKYAFIDCGCECGYKDAVPFTAETMAAEIVGNTEFTNAKILGYGNRENRALWVFIR